MEVNPEEIIGKYWQRIDTKFPELRQELEKLDFKPGIEAENSTDLADFLEHLDCGQILAPLKACYQRFGVVRPRLASRLKFAAFWKLKRFRSIREGHAYLRDHPDACKKLGFKKLPTYELLREFLNERLPGILGILNDEVLVEADRELQEHTGQRLFEEVSQDAVDLKARKTDEGAEWSEYYKEYGYKADLAVGLKMGMIATPVFLGINEHEGKCFSKQAEGLRNLGFEPKSWVFDGKYSSKESIALGTIGYRMEPGYKIQKDWVPDSRGTEGEIARAYQKHWQDKGFKPGAEPGDQLEFLYRKGEPERVGAYIRNKAMESYEADPRSYLKKYHRRNRSESTNSHLKEKLDLERGIPKGKTRAKSHVELCVLARNLVALTRLQQGVTENLTSRAYLS